MIVLVDTKKNSTFAPAIRKRARNQKKGIMHGALVQPG